eukprot:TRINITY_DN106_c0_g1_i1.p1 TRINITY_DN106_c0_g1~~TRINITY_DN106_c0_g1_i1.p1  ORF type:complete len:115 (-),score=9.64 TRINITY_DN106_c0_g1_i1:95-439(-)
MVNTITIVLAVILIVYILSIGAYHVFISRQRNSNCWMWLTLVGVAYMIVAFIIVWIVSTTGFGLLLGGAGVWAIVDFVRYTTEEAKSFFPFLFTAIVHAGAAAIALVGLIASLV